MNIYKLELKSQIRGMLIWGVSLSLVLIGFMLLFPSMQNESMKALTDAKLDSLPPEILAAFGIDVLNDFTQLPNFFGMVFIYINMAICIYAAALGATSLSREESDGTIEYLYAQPVTRSNIVAEKMLANVSAFAIIPIILSVISSVLLAIYNDGAYPYSELLTDVALIFSGLFFAGIIFMMIGFFVSTLLKSSKQAMPAALGIVFGTFLIGVAASLVEGKEFLLYLSPLDTVSPSKIIHNGFEFGGVMAGFIMAIVSCVFAFIVYNKKDLKV